MMKFVAATLMILFLTISWNNCSVENDRNNHLVYYVMAEQVSANASECAQFEYHSDLFNCSVTSISELIYHYFVHGKYF